MLRRSFVLEQRIATVRQDPDKVANGQDILVCPEAREKVLADYDLTAASPITATDQCAEIVHSAFLSYVQTPKDEARIVPSIVQRVDGKSRKCIASVPGCSYERLAVRRGAMTDLHHDQYNDDPRHLAACQQEGLNGSDTSDVHQQSSIPRLHPHPSYTSQSTIGSQFSRSLTSPTKFCFDPRQLEMIDIMKNGGNGCAQRGEEFNVEEDYEFGGGGAMGYKSSTEPLGSALLADSIVDKCGRDDEVMH